MYYKAFCLAYQTSNYIKIKKGLLIKRLNAMFRLKTKLWLSSLLLLFALLSCKKEHTEPVKEPKTTPQNIKGKNAKKKSENTQNKEENDGFIDGCKFTFTESNYYLYNIAPVKKLAVVQRDISYLINEFRVGVCNYASKYTLRGAEFKRVADSIGDGGFHIYKVEPSDHRWDTGTLQFGVRGIKLTALTDYNETHKAGSSLLDLVKATYRTYDLSKKVKDKCEYGPELIPEIKFFKKVAIKENLRLDVPEIHLDRYEMPSFNGSNTVDDTLECLNGQLAYFLTLEFSELPIEKDQKMRISVRFANGKTLTADFDAKLTKL